MVEDNIFLFMRTLFVYLCFFIMVYGNCCLFNSETPPAYYNHCLSIIPVLIFCLLFKRQYSLSIDRKWIILTVVSYVFMTLIFQRDSGNSSVTLLCYMLIPMFCCSVLPKYKYIRFAVFALIAFEALLCIFEYFTQNNLFFSIEEYGRFRSSGIWGHPLHNASIVSVIILLAVMSPLRSIYKVLFVFVGFVVLFTFNGRAAIISTLLCLALLGFIQRKQVLFFLMNKPLLGVLALIAVFYLFGYLSTSELGGKLFVQDTRNLNDGSAMTRFYLYDYVLSMGINEWLFGINDIATVFKSNEFSYIESTPISLILNRGIIVALPLMLFQYMDLYNYFGKVSSINRLIIILDIVIIGLSSESYIGIAPWVIIYITYVALFKNRQYESRNSNVFCIP